MTQSLCSTLVKNLRLKSRIYSDGGHITAMRSIQGHVMIMHPKDVAFSSLPDNAIGSIYCEASFTGEYKFEQL